MRGAARVAGGDDGTLTDEPQPELATDLVEYFVSCCPTAPRWGAWLGGGRAGAVRAHPRALDIVVLDRGPDGGLDVLEVGIEDLVTLSMLEDVGLLSENDLALACARCGRARWGSSSWQRTAGRSSSRPLLEAPGPHRRRRAHPRAPAWKPRSGVGDDPGG